MDKSDKKKFNKKKFKESHLMLISEMGKSVERALLAHAAKVKKFQAVMDLIAVELGIPKSDLINWGISEDGSHLERKKEKLIKSRVE